MIVKLLTEHHLKIISLKEGCRGSSNSTLVKMSNCWKSHAAAHILYYYKSLDGKQYIHTTLILSCQPRVTVVSCFAYKVIMDLSSIDHLCINPIRRIGLIHK